MKELCDSARLISETVVLSLVLFTSFPSRVIGAEVVVSQECSFVVVDLCSNGHCYLSKCVSK